MFTGIPDVATLMTLAAGVTALFAVPITAKATVWLSRELLRLVRGFFG